MNRNKNSHRSRRYRQLDSQERKFWMKAFLFYICVECFFTVFDYIAYSRNCTYCAEPVMAFVNQCVLDILFTYGLWYALNRFHRNDKPGLIVLNLIVFSVYFILLIAFKCGIEVSGIVERGTGSEENVLRQVVSHSWFDIGKYVMKLSVIYVLRFYIAYRKTGQQRTELALINKDLQLNLLKQQLSPHFYFNTLNNLYGLARNDSPKLPTALSQLSNIMHYVLDDCNEPRVLLKQEINFLQSYIALEKLRYEQETLIEMKVDGEVRDQQILPLLLVQFVENAFKHGMKEKSEKNWMQVNMVIREQDLLFSVDNSYYAETPAGGIGLNSVKRRLNLQYDGRYDMNSIHQDDRFCVTLKLILS